MPKVLKKSKKPKPQPVALAPTVNNIVETVSETGFEHHFTPNPPLFNRQSPLLLTIRGDTAKGHPVIVGVIAITKTRISIAFSRTQCELLDALQGHAKD